MKKPTENTPTHYFTFLRHGESVGNAGEIHQGQHDFPLTERGVEQARALAARWKNEGTTFDHCIASPLLRARQTAEVVTAAIQVPLEFDPDWMEINIGVLSGVSHAEADILYPRPEYDHIYQHVGRTGESWWELYLRAGRAIQSLLDRPPGRYLVVAHGGVFKAAMYVVLSIPPQADYQGPHFPFLNTSFAQLAYETPRHRWTLLSINDRAHWKEN